MISTCGLSAHSCSPTVTCARGSRQQFCIISYTNTHYVLISGAQTQPGRGSSPWLSSTHNNMVHLLCDVCTSYIFWRSLTVVMAWCCGRLFDGKVSSIRRPRDHAAVGVQLDLSPALPWVHLLRLYCSWVVFSGTELYDHNPTYRVVIVQFGRISLCSKFCGDRMRIKASAAAQDCTILAASKMCI